MTPLPVQLQSTGGARPPLTGTPAGLRTPKLARGCEPVRGACRLPGACTSWLGAGGCCSGQPVQPQAGTEGTWHPGMLEAGNLEALMSKR